LKNSKTKLENCFLRAFFEFGNALLRDFKTGNPQIDAENEDGFGEQHQLEWLLTRALFCAYATMKLLGIEPKGASVTQEFAEELGK
jgi:hypothetical protein